MLSSIIITVLVISIIIGLFSTAAGEIGGIYMIIISVTLLILFCNYVDGPTAIEVYQGKTTLQKVIVDGEVIDSIVIYKDK